MPLVAYYSSQTGNTHHFVEKLRVPSVRIPLSPKDPMPVMDAPFVLICPTYADEAGRGAIPKQVIHFLNNPVNRTHLLGVIAPGNKNFGALYGHAGAVIRDKCGVPLLYRFELRGTPTDVRNVRAGLVKLWNHTTTEQESRMIA